METIRAINIIAAAEEAGVDGTRTPGGAALHKQSQKIHLATVQAVIILQANGLNPDDDLATQTRLAAAVDRQITGKTSELQDEPTVARSILNDFYLQEAAASRLKMAGDQDPLAYVANPETRRDLDVTFDILERNRIKADAILKTASKSDMIAIASGRFDHVHSEHTRFAVGTILRHSEEQMATPTAAIPQKPPALGTLTETRRYPSTGIGMGSKITPVAPLAFGRRSSGAER
jgi:hypothetical protein